MSKILRLLMVVCVVLSSFAFSASGDAKPISRFVILSDLHPHPEAFEQLENLTANVIRLEPEFAVVLGDIAGDEVPGWSEPEITALRKCFTRMRAAGIEIYPVMGNHDVHERVRDIKTEWFCSSDPLPLNPLLGPGDTSGARERFLNGGPYDYAFNREGLRFVVVDSNIVPPKDSWEPERIARETPRWEAHREWMKEALCAPSSNPERLPTLVFVHQPEYLTGDRRMDSRPLFHALEACPETETVKMVFGGHWHSYEAFAPGGSLGIRAYATPPSVHSHDGPVEFIVGDIEPNEVRFEVRDSDSGNPTGETRYAALEGEFGSEPDSSDQSSTSASGSGIVATQHTNSPKESGMNTLQAAPPANAVVLFNGKDVSNWTTRDGKPAGWQADADQVLHVVKGTGDIMTKQRFKDFYLHLEFRCPDMPEATGQAKGNSGVFLQGRYEVQVLDSYGWDTPGMGDCGAVYNQFAPLTNACKPAMEWQTYDIAFRAPRCNDKNEVVENTQMTVFFNGVCIQNNIILPGVTGAPLDEKVWEPGPLLLQDHGDLVCYRNIWIVELPEKGSTEYGPK